MSSSKPDGGDVLSIEALERIDAAMPGGSRINPALLEVVAGAFLNLRKREGLLHDRGMRADLRALHRKLSSLAEELNNLPVQKLAILGISLELFRSQSGASGIQRMELLGDELKHLALALDSFLGRASQPLSRGDISVAVTLGILGSAYWRATGKRPTHSSHRDGQHVGKPLSPFGRLVVAFFREVDPSLTETALTTAVRTYVSSDEAKIPPVGVPLN